MNDVWYWPVLEAFRKHLEIAHEDKQWQGYNHDEVRFFEEHLVYEKFGDDECDKKLCKKAIRSLMDSGRCVYNYVGGSYIALPPDQS